MVIRIFTFTKNVSSNGDANLVSEELGAEPTVPKGVDFKLLELGGSIGSAGRVEFYHKQRRMMNFDNNSIPDVNNRVVCNNKIESGEKFVLHGIDNSGGSNTMTVLLIVEETKA